MPALDLVDGAGPFLQLLDIRPDVLDRRAVDLVSPGSPLIAVVPLQLDLRLQPAPQSKSFCGILFLNWYDYSPARCNPI